MKAIKAIGGGLVLMALCLLVAPVSSEAGMEWTVGRGKKYDFRTIQAAMDNATVQNGDTILVAPGRYKGAKITKGVTIIGSGNSGRRATVILPCGLKDKKRVGFFLGGTKDKTGTDATIRNFAFRQVHLPIYSTGADNVTVDNNTMINATQGITNWNGSQWKITNNTIKNVVPAIQGVRGGAGIVVGTDGKADAVKNVVKLNKITGKAFVRGKRNDEYSVAGIALVDNMTDKVVTETKVDNNTIDITVPVFRNKVTVKTKMLGIMLNDRENADNVTTTFAGNSFFGNTITVAGDGVHVQQDAMGAKPMPTANCLIIDKCKTKNGVEVTKPVPADFDCSVF